MLPTSPNNCSTQADCPHLGISASAAQLHCPAASSSSPHNAVAAACSCDAPLIFPPQQLPLLTAMDDSPPDSPTVPWRPGSSAYPRTSLISLTAPTGDLLPCSHTEQSERNLQRLYDTLSEASFDLSLRDIVEPPYAVDGSLGRRSPESSLQPEAEPSPEQRLPMGSCDKQKASACSRLKQQLQYRSSSCRKPESSKYTASTSPKGKLAFSFSYPRRVSVQKLSCMPLQALSKPHTPSSSAHKDPVKASSLMSLEHVLATTQELPALPLQRVSSVDGASSTLPRRKHSFKRSSSDVHRTSASYLNSAHIERTGELNFRGAFSNSGSSSRVHPSSQCSSCSSYTIFFKSRCTVCGKLYCSICAKDEMDTVLDGRRCKSTCNSWLGSKRLSRSMRSKCWPMCCNNVDVLNRKQVISGRAGSV